MISLNLGVFDPLTGTLSRGTAFMAYRMAHITRRTDSSHHIFRLRTPADVLAGGAMGKRVPFNISGFLQSGPQLVAAEIKFSLKARDAGVAEFRTNVALAELNKTFAAISARAPQPLMHKRTRSNMSALDPDASFRRRENT
jgi:hypothetical protein